MHRISHFEILTNRSVLIQAKTERFISDLRRLVQLLEAGIETEEERVGVFDLKCENYPVSARQLRLRRDNLMATISRLEVRRIHGDKGYRGHNYPDRFKVWISGQVRRVTKPIRREMRRRAAVEPVIGHLKDDHPMRRNYLKGRDGDRINAVLAAAGFNFSLLLRWFEKLLRAWLLIVSRGFPSPRLA